VGAEPGRSAADCPADSVPVAEGMDHLVGGLGVLPRGTDGVLRNTPLVRLVTKDSACFGRKVG
jgi:hypothetical protein